MNGEKIPVVENNEHLGQIVSGIDQEQKNIDFRINKARKALYSLLGPCFNTKCQLNFKLKMHLYRTFICPVLCAGLSTFVITDRLMESLNLFHRKCLKGILCVSKRCPTPGVHFILSEPPIEVQIHREVFNLFYTVWTNPQTKLFEIISYILANLNDKSHTWCKYLTNLCQQYGIRKPSELIKESPPTKSSYKKNIENTILAFHEKE